MVAAWAVGTIPEAAEPKVFEKGKAIAWVKGDEAASAFEASIWHFHDRSAHASFSDA